MNPISFIAIPVAATSVLGAGIRFPSSASPDGKWKFLARKKTQRDYIGSIVYPVVNPETGQTNAIALKIPKLQGNGTLKRECGLISDVSLPYQITYKYVAKRWKTNSDYYIIALQEGGAKTLYELLKHSNEFRKKSRLLVR